MNTTAPPPPPPPPPDDPFTSPGGNEFDGGSLDTGAPAVAASKSKTMVVMGGIGLVVIYMLYSIFFGGGEEKDTAPVEQEPQPVVQQEFEPPPLPEEEEPEFVPPPIIEAPPVPQPVTVLPVVNPEEDSALKAQMQARQRSSMMVVDGGNAVLEKKEEEEDDVATGTDSDSQFAANTANNSKVKKSIATKIGDLRRVIAQGRLIQATLETAINTDLPSPIRAIVSRDVYGEAGTIPLIPAGSRLIGQYNKQLKGGQSRVFVMWTRVIRPDGIDVQLGSPLVDQIGQAGVAGQVDTKFQYIFSRAVMASIVSIAFAIGSDEINPSSGDSGSSTTSSTFGTTQSGDAASTATVNALNRLGGLTESFLQQFLDIGPTILVDHGTPVVVFVNRDLIFPAELVGTQIIN